MQSAGRKTGVIGNLLVALLRMRTPSRANNKFQSGARVILPRVADGVPASGARVSRPTLTNSHPARGVVPAPAHLAPRIADVLRLPIGAPAREVEIDGPGSSIVAQRSRTGAAYSICQFYEEASHG